LSDDDAARLGDEWHGYAYIVEIAPLTSAIAGGAPDVTFSSAPLHFGFVSSLSPEQAKLGWHYKDLLANPQSKSVIEARCGIKGFPTLRQHVNFAHLSANRMSTE